MFVLELARDACGHLTSLTATGGGHGHGVGMCQVGAVGMAAAGARYDEILRQYYLRVAPVANCIDIDAPRDMVAPRTLGVRRAGVRRVRWHKRRVT